MITPLISVFDRGGKRLYAVWLVYNDRNLGSHLIAVTDDPDMDANKLIELVENHPVIARTLTAGAKLVISRVELYEPRDDEVGDILFYWPEVRAAK